MGVTSSKPISSKSKEAKSEGHSVFEKQNRISILNLESFSESEFISLSPSEHTRAYYIWTPCSIDSSVRFRGIEIRDLKDNWTVQVGSPVTTTMALSPEGDLITASLYSFARWTGVTSQKPKYEPIKFKSKSFPPDIILCMQFSPTGELISGHCDGSILSSNLLTGESKRLAKIGCCISLNIDKNGNLTCIDVDDSDKNSIHCWDKNYKSIGMLQTKKSKIYRFVVRLSEEQVAFANKQIITIWNVKTQKKIAFIKTRYSVESLSLSPEGLLVASDKHGLIEFFDPTVHQKVTEFQLTGMKSSLTFWNAYGYLTCIGDKEILDMKCDMQEQFSNALAPFLVANVVRHNVLPFLFFTPPKKLEMHAIAQDELKARP